MVAETQRFNVMAMIRSALAILLIPIVLTVVVTFGYGLYIGFQSRGDQDLISQTVLALTTSVGFLIYANLVLALVAFWRGRVLKRQVGDTALMHIIAAVVLALLARLVFDLIGNSLLIVPTLIAWVVGLVAGGSGAMTGKRVEA